jgi:ribosomal protein L35
MKTSKSVTKRIKFTKQGKMVRRPMAVDHFRTRSTTKNIRNKRKNRSLDFPRKSIVNY